jgi:hypothetical protein
MPSQYNHVGLEALLGSVEFANGNVSMLTKNTSIKVKQFSHWVLKNNAIHRVELKLAVWVCVDDDNDNILTEAHDFAIDRGYTVTNTPTVGDGVTTAAVAGIGGNVEVPASWVLPVSEAHYEVMSFGAHSSDRKYKFPTSIRKVILGPGDTIDVYHTRDYIYKPEVFDREAFTFLKGEYGLCAQVVGELGYGATNGNFLGFAQFQLDVLQKDNVTLTIDNGLGIDQVTSSNSLDITSSGNFQSAGRDFVVE